MSSIVELVVIVAIAIGLALAIQAFVVKPYRIPSGSMLPTLHIDQRVLVDRIGTHFSSPSVGDVIVFHPPKNYAEGCANPEQGQTQRPGRPEPCGAQYKQESSETFIKRVVGLPGDRISIVNGHVSATESESRTPHITPCDGSDSAIFLARSPFPGAITT